MGDVKLTVITDPRMRPPKQQPAYNNQQCKDTNGQFGAMPYPSGLSEYLNY